MVLVIFGIRVKEAKILITCMPAFVTRAMTVDAACGRIVVQASEVGSRLGLELGFV